MAIDASAWVSERARGGDTNGNRVREMVLRLDSPKNDPTADENAVLIFYDWGFAGRLLTSELSAAMIRSLAAPHEWGLAQPGRHALAMRGGVRLMPISLSLRRRAKGRRGLQDVG